MEKGELVILSSHSFGELESVVDQLIMIQNGEIVAQSSIQTMKQQGFKKLDDFYKQNKGGM
ncbi:hypothetical protein [Ligilactobacillus apodemi]|uniref:hypothetical protein n=1 Tax=Ligilactobacillus apodemi TaxID=307126 RepID=UPI0012DD45E1|nr:hypothetical protein [Ligilactobacillus apodemi]